MSASFEQTKQQAFLLYNKFERYFQNDKTVYYKYLQMAEQKTSISKAKLVLGALVIISLIILSSATFCNLVALVLGGLYPAYMSALALQSENPADQKRWLTYWTVVSVFLVPDFFFDILVLLVTVYPQFRLFFLVWCIWPLEPSGPQFLFSKVLAMVNPKKAKPAQRMKSYPAGADEVKEMLSRTNSTGTPTTDPI